MADLECRVYHIHEIHDLFRLRTLSRELVPQTRIFFRTEEGIHVEYDLRTEGAIQSKNGRSLFLGNFWTKIRSEHCFETVLTSRMAQEGFHNFRVSQKICFSDFTQIGPSYHDGPIGVKSLKLLRHPEVMKPLPRHSGGQHGLKTVFRSNFCPKMAEKKAPSLFVRTRLLLLQYSNTVRFSKGSILG